MACVLVAGGCQTYQPVPLNLETTRTAWLARSPSDESARAFATRLAAVEHGGGGAGEAAFDPSDGLTLAEAEPVALVFNRDLRLARLEAGVVRATAEFAGLWDDPVIGVDLERIVSGVPDPWVIAGTIGLTLPISGRLEVEKARAGARYTAELQRLAAREWATRAALRELWIEWSAQSGRLRLAEEFAARLAAVDGLARKQEEAGSLSRIDARVFGVELALSRAEIIASRARVRELELQLRDLLGLAPGAPVQLVESVVFAPRVADSAALNGAMETGNAELAAVRGEYDTTEQSLQLEVRKQYPDLSVSPGVGTDQGDERVLLGLSLPLPVWNRNQQGIAEATAEREAARGRFENTYEHLASRLAVALVRYEAGKAQRSLIETDVAPLADAQEEDVRRVAELGRVEPLLFLESLKAQHLAKLRLIDARAAESIGAARLDELVGPPIPSPSPVAPREPVPASPSHAHP